ncbi:hypothetical protein L3Y34_007183 [Caenorhabditis briggsae]|uniref:Uncharacterized protein n=1 Tax=Caenorhabditis briggsae TaxID=6238 RepID=A0AAE9A1S6_CAEBR|nr:hypothetical protein L3Y34_007183 [Caenorhabditis briggsae]
MLWVLFHFLSWAVITDLLMLPDLESRNYVRESFEKIYGSMENLSIKIAIYSEVSTEKMVDSWFGTSWVTLLNSYSVILYFVLGYKIMASLNQGLDYRSDRTLQLQRRLFSALAIQTAISICVSFMPCIPVLYGSAIRIDFLSWVNRMSSVGVSFFPFLDSLAVTMCIPALRYRCVHAYRYATIFFLVAGPFSERSRLGEFLLAGRCAFISGTYGILNTHFLYRFLSLRYTDFVANYFNPYGLILSVQLVLLHWILWAVVADYTMSADSESRNYVRESFEKVYGKMDHLNIKTVIFSEMPSEVVYRSWVGTLFVTFLASYSLILYFFLGYKRYAVDCSLDLELLYLQRLL